jgi:hypothetical protein
VWNLVSNIKGGTQAEGVWEQDAEENIGMKERLSGRRLERAAQWGASQLAASAGLSSTESVKRTADIKTCPHLSFNSLIYDALHWRSCMHEKKTEVEMLLGSKF